MAQLHEFFVARGELKAVGDHTASGVLLYVFISHGVVEIC